MYKRIENHVPSSFTDHFFFWFICTIWIIFSQNSKLIQFAHAKQLTYAKFAKDVWLNWYREKIFSSNQSYGRNFLRNWPSNPKDNVWSIPLLVFINRIVSEGQRKKAKTKFVGNTLILYWYNSIYFYISTSFPVFIIGSLVQNTNLAKEMLGTWINELMNVSTL